MSHAPIKLSAYRAWLFLNGGNLKSGSRGRGCPGLLLGEIIMRKAGHTGSAQWLIDMECAH